MTDKTTAQLDTLRLLHEIKQMHAFYMQLLIAKYLHGVDSNEFRTVVADYRDAFPKEA